MSLFINSSQEDTFRSLMDFFNGRRSRVLVSNQPYRIRVEIGSYWALTLDSAKGEVEASITKRDGGSYINLNFNFMKEYLLGLVGSFIGAVALVVLGYTIGNAMITDMSQSVAAGAWSSIYGVIVFGILMTFVVVMATESGSAFVTKRKFINELDMFVQSLQTKK